MYNASDAADKLNWPAKLFSFDPWFNTVLMAIEDVRINLMSYRKLPGLEDMQRARILTILMEGVRLADGTVAFRWSEKELEMQLIALVLFQCQGFLEVRDYMHQDAVDVFDHPVFDDVRLRIGKPQSISLSIDSAANALGSYRLRAVSSACSPSKRTHPSPAAKNRAKASRARVTSPRRVMVPVPVDQVTPVIQIPRVESQMILTSIPTATATATVIRRAKRRTRRAKVRLARKILTRVKTPVTKTTPTVSRKATILTPLAVMMVTAAKAQEKEMETATPRHQAGPATRKKLS